MKKQLIIIGIAVLFIIVGLSGCNENNEEIEYSVVGVWKTGYSVDYGDYIMTLRTDGYAKYEMEYGDFPSEGTWVLNNDKLVIELTGITGDTTLSFKIKFEDYGRVIIAEEISSGKIYTWEKL